MGGSGLGGVGPQVWIEMNVGLVLLGARRVTVGPGRDPGPAAPESGAFPPLDDIGGAAPAPTRPPALGEPGRASLDAHWGPGRFQCADSGP